ncbi:MAG: AAA family ATPase [Pirellulales bacterium]|nr:AAA family ATPase [Pirellulales bacterium]
MKASKVLLRWYKSFNVNYMNYADRRQGILPRPWNSLHVDGGGDTDYEFIEIPIEKDITTIVGANESGKSHLISAISKVIKGTGIPGAWDKGREFGLTDLCHYASVRSKNATVWPNIGMEFAELSEQEKNSIGEALGAKGASLDFGDASRFTVILGPKSDEEFAYVYVGNSTTPVTLDKSTFGALRKLLPTVKFIQSNVAISDHVPICDLLAEMGGKSAEGEEFFGFEAAQAAVRFLKSLTLTANQQVPADIVGKLSTLQQGLTNSAKKKSSAVLETLLFRDVLEVTSDTVEFLAKLGEEDRSYAEGLVETWNDEVEKTLNLSHYWQQDDLFKLRMDFKRGIIFFEISDKTGAVYTFRERSSGLRFFLSYYIQAKALEIATRENNCIILMDEPDSFLSIIGQRNLLAVFESLVSADTSRRNTQLVYTTHSPFLINRNFPRRIRLVRKGDAEEGTQFVDESRLRRYEPVRSALGIDCAQTLFMGVTNVVLEGPTDQFLVSELIRLFVTPENVSDFLDLNAVVLVSADSAPGIEKLLAASRWGDEKNPATVVVVDNDDAGELCRKRITGVERHRDELIKNEFVLTINETHEADENQQCVTTEDLVPTRLYAKAVCAYVERWFPDEYKAKKAELTEAIENDEYGQNGLVADTKEVMTQFIHPGRNGYDKMGVLHEVVRLATVAQAETVPDETFKLLRNRMISFCRALRERIEASEQAERRTTGKQAVVRVVRDFFVKHKESTGVYDLELVLKRLEREVELLGDDGEPLNNYLRHCLDDVRNLRSSNQQRIVEDEWAQWRARLERVRKNPLNPNGEGGSSQNNEDGKSTTAGVDREATTTAPTEISEAASADKEKASATRPK